MEAPRVEPWILRSLQATWPKCVLAWQPWAQREGALPLFGHQFERKVLDDGRVTIRIWGQVNDAELFFLPTEDVMPGRFVICQKNDRGFMKALDVVGPRCQWIQLNERWDVVREAIGIRYDAWKVVAESIDVAKKDPADMTPKERREKAEALVDERMRALMPAARDFAKRLQAKVVVPTGFEPSGGGNGLIVPV